MAFLKSSRKGKAGVVSAFTLLELLVAISIFSMMMALLFMYIDAAQRAWTDSSNRGMVYENARIAFDLLARDIQSAYYSREVTPFWHKAATDSSWGANRNESLAFISTTNVPPFDNCESKLCEIKYQLYYASSHADTSSGWLMRSVTGDHVDPTLGGGLNSKWNYHSNFDVGLTGASKAFTGNDDSGDPYFGVIPYVTALSFKCLKRDGTEITPDSSGTSVTEFPTSIAVSMTLMDRFSYLKWQELDTAGAPNKDLFKVENSLTFQRTFYLGERGQNE